jgi:hypothetical protein
MIELKDERAVSAVKAALRWVKAHNVRWKETERKIYSKQYKYAGTTDGLCLVDSCSDPTCCSAPFKDHLTVADWKTSGYLHLEYLMQTAAYMQALQEELGLDIQDRFILRLDKEDGKFEPWYAPKETFARDLEGFLTCLKLSQLVKSTEERIKSQKNTIKAAKKIAKESAKAIAKEQAKLQKALEKAEAKRLKEIEKAKIKEEARLKREADKAAKKNRTLPDPDYVCGAAFCDDPACNTHTPTQEEHAETIHGIQLRETPLHVEKKSPVEPVFAVVSAPLVSLMKFEEEIQYKPFALPEER